MAKSFTNWKDLEKAIQKEMYAAHDKTTMKSLRNLEQNVTNFYSYPGGKYKRTGQLQASPQLDSAFRDGNSAASQISINTGTQYDPAGRDTETIYGYAEAGGLLGKGGFWKETEEDIQRNLDNEFGARFDK